MTLELKDKTIAITRDSRQSKNLIEQLNKHGAKVITWPVIRIEKAVDYKKFDRHIAMLRSGDWILFSSVNAVRYTLPRFSELGLSLEKFKIASVGPRTSHELEEHGIKVDVTPHPHSAQSLIEHFRTKDIKDTYFILPSSDLAREVLEVGLSSMGAKVLKSVTYRTTTNKRLNKRDILSDIKNTQIDCLTFFSPSAFHALLEITDYDILEILKAGTITLAAIGPTTASTISKEGIKVSIIPKESSSESFIQALIDYYMAEQQTEMMQ
jgi:uroporphyrinogen-III synthase